MQEKSSSKYSTLYNEMKDNILIEDFINDIEVNFNTRLDNIEKNSKLQLETLLKEMTEKEKNINDIITIGEYKQKEQYRIYEEFSNKLIFELKNLSEEIKEQVSNINYDEQLEEINNKIEMIENRDIEEKDYNKDIEEKDENKELKENKKNNIINLRQFFMEARKNNKRVFSIEETINYEDLERLSAYVIDLDAM